MNERVRVLHCLSSVSRGGVERRRAVLARELDPARYEQRLLTRTMRGEVVEAIRGSGVPVTAVGGGGFLAPAPIARAVKEALAFRPHIVHGAVFEGLSIALAAGKATGAHIVIEETSHATNRSPRGHALFRNIVAAADACVAISPAVRDYLCEVTRVPADKITLITNGISAPTLPPGDELAAARRELGIEQGAFVVGTVSRLTDNSMKRVSDLLEATALLVPECPELRVLIVGDGIERPGLMDLAARLGIMKHVSFLGNREDTGRYYGIMDVFTLVSSREGFGLVVPEAMFCRLPVVGTAVGGIKDSVVHGETGLLVPPLQPRAIADALLELRRDPERRRRFGEAGRQRAERLFSAQRYARDVDAFYQELLARPRSLWQRWLT
jgi:glycosyltransferase involved in cell wall biosynthesis